jgi:polyisoprenoid-binding protein YceI
VTDEISGKDRREIENTMKQKVLETATYPSIVYEGPQASVDRIGDGRYKAVINGILSLHGATRTVPVTAQISLNGDMLRSYGEFSISQTDFGIPLVSVAGGTLKLKDELKFAFDIVARKQE